MRSESYNQALESATKRGDVVVTDDVLNSLVVLPLDIAHIQQGDVDYFADEPVILRKTFPNGKMGYYTLLASGKQFWLSVLSRGGKTVDGNRVCSSGNVVDYFQKHPKLKTSLQALAGKEIRFPKVEQHRCKSNKGEEYDLRTMEIVCDTLPTD